MLVGARFILPVCIDDTPEKRVHVPEQFLKAHWTRLPGGVLAPEVAARLKEITAANARAEAPENAQHSTLNSQGDESMHRTRARIVAADLSAIALAKAEGTRQSGPAHRSFRLLTSSATFLGMEEET